MDGSCKATCQPKTLKTPPILRGVLNYEHNPQLDTKSHTIDLVVNGVIVGKSFILIVILVATVSKNTL